MISRHVVRALIIVLSRLNLADFRVKSLCARIFYNCETLFSFFFFFFLLVFKQKHFVVFQPKIYLLRKIFNVPLREEFRSNLFIEIMKRIEVIFPLTNLLYSRDEILRNISFFFRLICTIAITIVYVKSVAEAFRQVQPFSPNSVPLFSLSLRVNGISPSRYGFRIRSTKFTFDNIRSRGLCLLWSNV